MPSSSRSGRRPLEGVRVVDLTAMWAGPYATMILADLGAEVIKVESPKAWDNIRTLFAPPTAPGEHWWNTSNYFHEYGRNKKGLTLDLADPRGKELLGRLVAVSDIVIENFRTDVPEKLGLTYDWMRGLNDQIIAVGMAGFGKTGPDAHAMGYGPIIEQMSGMTSLTGYGDDGIPMKTGISYGDPIAGLGAASAAMVALIQRLKTGKGQYIDLAQREVMTAQVGEAFMDWCMNERLPEHMGNGHDWMAPHNAYACEGEDQWVTIAVRTDQEWDGLVRAMGSPAWASEEAYGDQMLRWENRGELDARMSEWTGGLTKEAAFDACRAEGVPCGPVYHMADLFADEQLAARGFYEAITHEEHGTWMVHGWTWRATDAGPCIVATAPDFGQHNQEVLGDLLGLSAAEIAGLESEQIIATAPIGVPTRSEIEASGEGPPSALKLD